MKVSALARLRGWGPGSNGSSTIDENLRILLSETGVKDVLDEGQLGFQTLGGRLALLAREQEVILELGRPLELAQGDRATNIRLEQVPHLEAEWLDLVKGDPLLEPGDRHAGELGRVLA